MDEFWTFSRVFRLRKLQNCNLTKNPTKFANFGSILTGLKFKMRKNSSNWKEIENFSWLKLSEEFTRKSTSNSSSCCLTSSYLTNFFRVLNIFTNFARVFRLKSFKITTWQKSVKIGPRSSQKANFCLFSFHFHDFFVKNVVKLFILYLSHFLNFKIQNQKSIKSLFCLRLRLLRNIEGALTRIRHRLIPRIFRAKTPILYPICFHDFSYSICFHEFFVPKFQFCIPSVFTNFRENARFRHHTPENVKIVKIGSLRSKNK